MTLERTHDYDFLNSVVRNESIYRMVTDDAAPPREHFRVPESLAIWYVAILHSGYRIGFFALVPQNCVTWELHCCLLPMGWGKAAEAAREMIQWTWQNSSSCRRLITNVPIYNRLAYSAARKAGFIEFGVNPNSFLKGGKLYDQSLLGVSKQ